MRRCWLVALIGCSPDTDPRWQLRHDRIVAVRTTPSHVPAGQVASLDGLITRVDGGPTVASPIAAGVAPGGPFADLVRPDGDGWQVIAPDDAALDRARAALDLAAGAPVPVVLTARFAVGAETFDATKQVWLGDARDNPVIGAVTLDGAPAPAAITVALDTDVALAVDAPAPQRARWLTSCGSLDADDDEPRTVLRVAPDDARAGALVLVIRDDGDGVAWQAWPITADPR